MKDTAKELLFFDKMVTPKIINIIYWIVLVAIVISGIGTMFSFSFFAGLLVIVVGTVYTRIMCELLIIFFKMNEALQDIRNK